MLEINPSTRVFICSQAIDMRLSHDGLAGMVKSYFRMNPTCGYLFVFFSRRRDRMKLLVWKHDGFGLYYHRMERGTYSWIDELDLEDGGEIEASDFAVIVTGVNPVSVSAGKFKSRKNNAVAPRVRTLQLV
jgi:transposase